MVGNALRFIEQYVRILYLIHIPAGFASVALVTTLGFLALTKYNNSELSLPRRGAITYRLWMAYCMLMFVVIATASLLAAITGNSFVLYMVIFLLYLNLQLLLSLRGTHTRLFNRITIVIGLVASYIMIVRGLLYAIQQQMVPATIVFFGIVLAIISTLDFTAITRANRVGLIIRNGVGAMLVASTAMINIYVFRDQLAWISWIIPTVLLTPIIVMVMFINDVYSKKNRQPHSALGRTVLQNIIALKHTFEQ